jgi:hypothetical protein
MEDTEISFDFIKDTEVFIMIDYLTSSMFNIENNFKEDIKTGFIED